MDVIGAAAVLNIHTNVHSTPPAAHPVHRAPKLEQPKISLHAKTEYWDAFQRRWEIYRVGSGIDAASTSTQSYWSALTSSSQMSFYMQTLISLLVHLILL